MPAVDFTYLRNFLGGDLSITLEVLSLFRQQAEGWAKGLESEDGDWRALAHTIKGAARGVGANALGDACHTAEFGEREDLAAVRRELAAAIAEIEAFQAEQGVA